MKLRRKFLVLATIASAMLVGIDNVINCAAEPMTPHTDAGSFITQPFGHIYSFEYPLYSDENPTLREAKENTNHILMQIRKQISEHYPEYDNNPQELLAFLYANKKRVAQQLNTPEIYVTVFISRLARTLHTVHIETSDNDYKQKLATYILFLGYVYTYLCEIDFCIEKIEQADQHGFGNIIGIAHHNDIKEIPDVGPYRRIIKSDAATALLVKAQIPMLEHKRYAQLKPYLTHSDPEVLLVAHFFTWTICINRMQTINDYTKEHKALILQELYTLLNSFPVDKNNQEKTIFTENMRKYMCSTLALANKDPNLFKALCENHSLSTIFDICMSLYGHSMPELTHIFALLEETVYRMELKPKQQFASADERNAEACTLAQAVLQNLKPILHDSIHMLKNALEPYKTLFRTLDEASYVKEMDALEPFTFNNLDIEIERAKQKERADQRAKVAASAAWKQDVLRMIEEHRRGHQPQQPAQAQQRTKKPRNRGKRTVSAQIQDPVKDAVQQKASPLPAAEAEPKLQATPCVAPYTYDPRVLQWFKNPPKTQKGSVEYHDRPLTIDAFVQAYGTQRDWQNRRFPSQPDIQYLLPGYIEKAGKKQFAVFACTLTRDKRRCYHRHCKTFRSLAELNAELKASGAWNIDGGTQAQRPTCRHYELTENEYGTILEETEHAVKIQDHRNGAIITLFKSCFDTELK